MLSTCYARPTFFRGCIAEAKQPHVGYAHAGFHLALHARYLVQGEVDDQCLAVLDQAVADRDEDALLKWFLSTLPRCMALVPSRRRASFMRGVMQAVEEERL
jgi:hypothetical protein